MAQGKGIDADLQGSFLRRATSSMRLIGGSLSLMWQASPGLLLLAVLPLAAQSLLPAVQMVAVRGAVNAVVTHRGLARWLLLLVGALGLAQLLAPVSALIQAHLADRFTRLIRRRLITAVNGWPGTTRLEDPDTLNDLEFVTGQIEYTGPELLIRTFEMSLTGLTIALAVGLVWSVSPWLALLVLASQLPPVVGHWQFQNAVGSSLAYQVPSARRLEYFRDVSIALPEAKDLRLRSAFGYLRHRYDQIFARAERDIIGIHRSAGTRLFLGQVLSAALTGWALVWLVTGVAHGGIDAGQASMTLAGIITIAGAMTGLAFGLGFIPFALQAVPMLHRLLDAGPDVPLPASGRTRVPDGPVEVRFDDVVFTYPGQSAPTLNGVTFTVPAGESLALVGHNGSGKTTIVKLLLRFHDVDSGRVLVDGTDIREWDIAALRHATGALFQDFARWELTARENIGLGDVAHLDDEAAVMAAARAGNADTFVRSLPDGYDTRVGTDLGDRALSGGQWQRLALSRATMSRARLLVLDEPTAELDPRAESEVFDRYAALASERTIILVSHRFSTVRQADRIVVLDDGRVREHGTHAELMAAAGEYARLYRLQASQYVDLPPLADPDDETPTFGGALGEEVTR